MGEDAHDQGEVHEPSSGLSTMDGGARRDDDGWEARMHQKERERASQWMKYSLLLSNFEDEEETGGEMQLMLLLPLVSDSSVHVRRKALDDIANVTHRDRLGPKSPKGGGSDEGLLGAVCKALFDADRHVRRRAAYALPSVAEKGDGRVVDMLSNSGLTDEDEVVRGACVRALLSVAERGDQTAVDALLRSLETDGSLLVQYHIIRTLEAIAPVGDRKVVGVLLERLAPRESGQGAGLGGREGWRGEEDGEEEWGALEQSLDASCEFEGLIRYRVVRGLAAIAQREDEEVSEALLSIVEESCMGPAGGEEDTLVWTAAWTALQSRLGIWPDSEDTEPGAEGCGEGRGQSPFVSKMVGRLAAWLQKKAEDQRQHASAPPSPEVMLEAAEDSPALNGAGSVGLSAKPRKTFA